MADLLDSRLPMGPFGWYHTRSSGIEQWPALNALDVADRHIVEEVQKGRRRLALIRTPTNDLLFEHYEHGNPPPEDNKRWGYRVFQLSAGLGQPGGRADTTPNAKSYRVSFVFVAFIGLVALFVGSLVGVGASFGLLGNQMNSIVLRSEELSKKSEELSKKADIILANTDATVKASSSTVQPIDPQAVQRIENQLDAIEQQTKATATREALAAYLAEIASNGDASLLTIVNKLRSSKCTLDNWKACKQ